MNYFYDHRYNKQAFYVAMVSERHAPCCDARKSYQNLSSRTEYGFLYHDDKL